MSHSMCLLALLFLDADLQAQKALHQLGSPKYTVRARAHCLLARLGPLARPRLEACYGRCTDPEKARRVELLLRPWEAARLEARSRKILPRSWPRQPWLSLYGVGVTSYLSQARLNLKLQYPLTGKGQRGCGAPDWPEYREATRLWILSRLTQKRPVEEIRDELDRMATEERWWILQNGRNHNPPILLPGFARP